VAIEFAIAVCVDALENTGGTSIGASLLDLHPSLPERRTPVFDTQPYLFVRRFRSLKGHCLAMSIGRRRDRPMRVCQRYHELFRLWFAFGFPAFGAVLAI